MDAPHGLHADRITVTLGQRVVLDGTSVAVVPGEVAALLAPSGAGKSTLLRALVRLVDVDSGAITLNGRDIRNLAAPGLRRRVGLVGQSAAMLPGSVADNLRHGVPGLDDAGVVAALDAVALDAAFANRDARELSGGERARVALARALTRGPEFLLLDEPTAALDDAAATRVGATLRHLAASGLGMLVATHDAAFAGAHADRRTTLR